MPTPNKDEKQKDFISRCMDDKSLQEQYNQAYDRFSVCNSCWEKANLKENSTAFEIDMSSPRATIKLAKADEETQEGEAPITPQEALLTNMLQMQSQYRIFHWQTKSYSEHKAFGKIYEILDENIDSFIETFMGKYGRIVTSPELEIEMQNYKDIASCVAVTDVYISFLTNINAFLKPEDTDLFNIRDTILSDINRLKYLLTLQ
jgi:hypothetical protein